MEGFDLDQVRDEIREFASDAAANDSTLVGLVLIARTIEQVGEEICRLLTIIAKAQESIDRQM